MYILFGKEEGKLWLLNGIRSIRKKIGNLQLNDINLKIEPGYIIGLLGVNGSGKTTLINTILNLYKKDSGVVKINGISMETNEKEAKDQIGFVSLMKICLKIL